MKKLTIGLCAILIAVVSFVAINKVKASQYYSTLSLGKGSYVFGATRNYTAGDNWFSVVVNSWQSVDGLNYTKLFVSINNNINGVTNQVDCVRLKINSNQSYPHWWGYLPQQYRYYYFTTYVDGYAYGGVQSNLVTMSSGTD